MATSIPDMMPGRADDSLAYAQRVFGRGRLYRARRWTYGASLGAHGVAVLVLALLTAVRPWQAPPLRVIEVQIVSEAQSRAGQTPAATPAPATLSAVAPKAVVKAPVAAAVSAGGPVVDGDGMVRPSHMLTGGLLQEAASKHVREALPTLAPDERRTQLCNIETTEQITAAYPGYFADTVSASAFGDTIVTGNVVEAPQAAFRSKRRWFAVSFICTVAADFASVTDYRFKIGAEIPRDEWDSHNLIEADAEE